MMIEQLILNWFDQNLAWGKLTGSDIFIGIFLSGIAYCLDKRMRMRHQKNTKYSMASNIENTMKIFSQVSEYSNKVMDEPDGEIWIDYLKNYIKLNHDSLQNYYDQMQINYKELNNLKKKYTEPVKIIIDGTEWTLYDYFKKVLTTNESNIKEFKILGTQFNIHCADFFKNAKELEDCGEINSH